MSVDKDIPWNRKPRNGLSVFFTKASFSKWLQDESHESRLAANLDKFCKGVVLPKLDLPAIDKVGRLANQNATAPDSATVNQKQLENMEACTSENFTEYKKSRKNVETRGFAEVGQIGEIVAGENSIPVKDVEMGSGPSNPTRQQKQGEHFKNVTRDKMVNNATSNENRAVKEGVESKQPDNLETLDSNFKLPSPKLSPNKETTEDNMNEAEKKKKVMENNILFYNDPDRKDKYTPVLARKRPRCQKPSLSAAEQKSYLDMKRRFSKLDLTHLTPQQAADYEIFKGLAIKVEKEQEKFMKALRYSFSQCDEDYRYIHKEARKYINDKFIVKKERVTKYPRFYHPVKRVSLGEESHDSTLSLQYVQPLLLLGTVPRMVLPQIVSGLPQPCTPTDSKKVSKVFPVVRDVVKGVCVWDQEPCSQDVNAEQLAVPNKCDFVLSSSAMKHLIDHQGNQNKLWNIPIVVREYDIQDGDKKVSHKVIYIDKPLIKTSLYTIQERNKLYQKYALKSVAIRPKQKPHVFANIRPSSEVVKYVDIEDVHKEMEEYCKFVIEDKSKTDFPDGDVPTGDENEIWQPGRKFGRRKRKKGAPVDEETGKKSVGMFDVENELDDLETFGMERSWKSSAKSPPGKTIKSPELASSKKEVDGHSGPLSKSGRKSIESDLEMLKQELNSLKGNKVQSGVKSSELNYTDSTSTGVKIDQGFKKPNISKAVSKQLSNDPSELEEDEDIKNTTDKNVAHNESEIEQADASKNTSKKNISSLSERLKQMSTIRSKLNMKTLQNELSVPPSSFKPHDVSAVSQVSDNSVGHNGSSNLTNLTGNNKGMDDSDSDSDHSDDGLVIDMPAPVSFADTSPEKIQAGVQSTAHKDQLANALTRPAVSSEKHLVEVFDENIENPTIPYSDIPEKLAKASGEQMKDKGEVKPLADAEVQERVGGIWENENEPVDSDCVEKPEVNEKAELKNEVKIETQTPDTETLSLSTRGSKRRSIETSAEETPVKRRVLRSSKSCDFDQPVSVHSHYTRRSVQKSGTGLETQVDTGTSLIKIEGKPRTLSNDRVTRSKSSSTEVGTDFKSPDGRVTRQSSDKEKDTKETRDKLSSDASHDDTDDERMEIADDHMTDTDDHMSTSDDQMTNTGGHMTSTDDHMTNTGGHMTDADDHMATTDAVDKDEPKAMPKRRGRPPKKQSQANKETGEVEARKIKEMADAMKKKVEQTVDNNPDIIAPNFYGSGSLDRSTVPSANQDETKGGKENEQDTSNKETENLGVDGILNLQAKLWKPPENKGTTSGSFAAKHGMSKVMFPLKHNVTYHQWKLGDLNLLIRCSYHGYANPQGFVHITTKMEYQPFFGFEKQTTNDVAKNWMDAYIRPKCTLVRARINPYNSEVMMMDYVDYNDLIPPDSQFRPGKAMKDLQSTLEGLKDLPAGQYLLNNQPRKHQVAVFRAAEEGERGPYDLHYYHASQKKFPEGKEPTHAKWVPIDTDLFLPHQKKMNLVPCTYNPNAFDGKKKPEEGKKPGKRKKRRKPRKPKE